MGNTKQVDEGPEQAPSQAELNVFSDIDLCEQVVGDYKLLRRIGSGVTGQVYLAQQLSLGREVALKVFGPRPADSCATRTALARFKREAETLARATHPNIIQIYAIGKAAGFHYMALEYVAGGNLHDYVEKNQPVAAAAGLKVMLQIAAAVHRAGELNIIHRDIKPENILIGPSGEIKVADFGLMRCFDGPAALTASGLVMGTPLYMSPEQLESRQAIDCRSDIYSFGATCYFMFAARPPFAGITPLEVAYKHVHRQPEPLRELRPDLPVELCAVIERMMAKQPVARFQTTRELIKALEGMSERLQSMPAAADGGSAVLGETPTVPVRPRIVSPGRWYYLLGALCLVALIGGALLRQRNEPASPRVTASRDACHSCDTKLPASQEKELELLARVKSNYKANGPLDLRVLSGLSAAVDLGLHYLNDRRLDEADALFQQVCPRGVEECHGRLLHEVGKAMVLAYRDEPAESNKQFFAFLSDIDRVEALEVEARSGSALPQASRDEIAIFTLLWNNEDPAVSLREMVARALHHNFQNDPRNFPGALEPFRHPPRPSKARVTPRD